MSVIEKYLSEVIAIQKELENYKEDNPSDLISKINAMTQMNVYIGKISSIIDGEYKRIYANRKLQQAIAEVNAPSPKKANAEIEIAPLRSQESDAYEQMMRWRNAFTSTTEQINGLKLLLRMIMRDDNI